MPTLISIINHSTDKTIIVAPTKYDPQDIGESVSSTDPITVAPKSNTDIFILNERQFLIKEVDIEQPINKPDHRGPGPMTTSALGG